MKVLNTNGIGGKYVQVERCRNAISSYVGSPDGGYFRRSDRTLEKYDEWKNLSLIKRLSCKHIYQVDETCKIPITYYVGSGYRVFKRKICNTCGKPLSGWVEK